MAFIALFLSSVSAPTVLVRKEIVSIPAGEGFDLKVAIHIHNTGDEAIYDVGVNDQWGEHFSISPNAVNGNKCTYENIPAGKNVTCEEVIVPNTFGAFYVLPALVRYKSSTDSEESQYVVGHAFTDAPLEIYPKAFYKRNFTSHVRETICFLLLCGFIILVPRALYVSQKNKNEFLRKYYAEVNKKSKSK